MCIRDRNNGERAQKKAVEEKARAEYRNTERGRHEKNSKGIYYTNGNYEAFARPRKPEGVDEKSAYIVGSGLASLAAACFLVRDGQMEGSHIHILEAMDIAGGACDGINDPTRGYVMRGGREMENHFECLWDLFRSIPSIAVSYTHLIKKAFVKVGIGAEKKSRVISEKEKRITAFHESGHAILFHLLPDVGPVYSCLLYTSRCV